jgi:hypothetical protein
MEMYSTPTPAPDEALIDSGEELQNPMSALNHDPRTIVLRRPGFVGSRGVHRSQSRPGGDLA